MLLRRLYSLLLITLLIGAFAGLLVYRGRQARTLRMLPYGRFTAQQIRDRAGTLCRLLLPAEDALNLTVQRTSEGTPMPAWSAEGTDASGQGRIYLTWDAATGELYSVGLMPQAASERQGAPMQARTAVLVAWEKLRLLGMAAQAARWHSAGPPHPEGSIWVVTWQAARRRAVIKLNRWTGRLVEARCWRETAWNSSGEAQTQEPGPAAGSGAVRPEDVRGPS